MDRSFMPAFSFAFFKRKAAPSLQCVLACVYLSSYVVISPSYSTYPIIWHCLQLSLKLYYSLLFRRVSSANIVSLGFKYNCTIIFLISRRASLTSKSWGSQAIHGTLINQYILISLRYHAFSVAYS